MKKARKILSVSFVSAILSLGVAACGSSGGGGDGGGNNNNGSTSTTIQGSLSSANTTARTLAPGEGGISGVSVSALGDSDTTDNNGNFNLSADGNAFPGGAVEFKFDGAGINDSVVLNNVAGGPGTMALVAFVLEDNGSISGESSDAAGNVLSSSGGGVCDVEGTFVDGGEGALWKPQSERTGNPVILMPAEYRNADVAILNNAGNSVADPIIRDCCSNNGGREHIFLNRSAGELAGAGIPLTVRFVFPDGFVDCRSVPDPTQRYD